MPIYEPGLTDLVVSNHAAGRLKFTTYIAQAVRSSHVIFIAVGTPTDEDGSADLNYVLNVARTIGESIRNNKIVVTKSTVPVGTAKQIRRVIESLTDVPVTVCSNPEFLKEGAAIADFMRPDRVVLGVDSQYAATILTRLYKPFVRNGRNIIITGIESAEIIKYAANAMLATRISFMNSVAHLCEVWEADVDEVRSGVGSDSRIGASFLYPGIGYGGSCFPKDVRAFIQSMKQSGVESSILRAVDAVNEEQKRVPLNRLIERFGDDMSDLKVGVWGLAFKPNTDDVREAPSLITIEGLLEMGASVVVHDPEAMTATAQYFGPEIEYAESEYLALKNVDALVVHTEWPCYRAPDFDLMKTLMRRHIIIDGRNLFHPSDMYAHGFDYQGIGRT